MRSIILRGSARPIAVVLAVISIVVLLRGHDAPGGGFIAGLLMTSAYALYLVAFGPRATRQVLYFHPRTLLAVGLAAVLSAAVLPLLLGDILLEAQWWFAIEGVTKVGTVLLFDTGVYLVVWGTALLIFLSLARPDPGSSSPVGSDRASQRGAPGCS